MVEKPFLTFGLPRDAFIPLAGVAEFTLGFGLLWTPLIRLSAVALLVILTLAVWPFGRVEIIGHGLVMAMPALSMKASPIQVGAAALNHLSDDIPTGEYAKAFAQAGLHVGKSRAHVADALGLMWIVQASKPAI